MTALEYDWAADSCAVELCGKPARTRGWCSAHYERWRVHGSPLGGGPTRASPGAPLKYLQDVVLVYDGDECLPWPFGRMKTGYGSVTVGGKTKTAHRVVCEYVNGAPPSPLHQAAHSCGKGHEGCVNPRHLRWATCLENHEDTILHGTRYCRARGQKNASTKLSEEQVRTIRSLRDHVPGRELARRYGVSRSAIRCIFSGRSWGWI